MSLFDRDEFTWRETYFVLFHSAKRPSLERIESVLKGLNPRFQLIDHRVDDENRFESITLVSPEDYAALDISYLTGDEVTEQAASAAEELKATAIEPDEKERLAQLPQCDARFDVMHFERQTAGSSETEIDEMFDPSALLIALDALAELTDGVVIDPQSGSLL